MRRSNALLFFVLTLPSLGIVLLWALLPSVPIPDNEIISRLKEGRPVMRAFKFDPSLLQSCSKELPDESYALLRFRYHHTWKTVTINGEPLSLVGALKDSEPGGRPSRMFTHTPTKSKPTLKIGRTDGIFNFHWFNPADAASFSIDLHPEYECSLPLRLVKRPGDASDPMHIFDVIPIQIDPVDGTTELLIGVPILTILVRSKYPTNPPTFQFASPESAIIPQTSLSSTYPWRANILLPLLRYVVLTAVIFVMAVTLLFTGLRLWARWHPTTFVLTPPQSSSSHSKTHGRRQSASAFFGKVWANMNPDAEPALRRLWTDALDRARSPYSSTFSSSSSSSSSTSSTSSSPSSGTSRGTSPSRNSYPRGLTPLKEDPGYRSPVLGEKPPLSPIVEEMLPAPLYTLLTSLLPIHLACF
ncbi:hypothetical protein DL93DRAFT_2168203 [Clavulina sp. PMI_390]|nr:hypothetical protein DL93DRAFT_2168203 [Clavulina sp. PMI_390]